MILSKAMPLLLAISRDASRSQNISSIRLLYLMSFLLCARQQGSPDSAITCAIFSSYFKPQISLIISTPAAIPAFATSDLYVSSEIGTLNLDLIASITGATLSISSCTEICV